MPVKTTWPITYKQCGHSEDKDLSHKPADKRAGFARWLGENKTCTPCWRKANGGDSWIEDREEWLAQRRAAEQQEAADWAEQHQMPALTGTDRAVAFAERVRHELMHALYIWAVEEDNASPEDYDNAEETARHLDRAGWWLDQREQAAGDPGALLELLAAAAADGAGSDCENTY